MLLEYGQRSQTDDFVVGGSNMTPVCLEIDEDVALVINYNLFSQLYTFLFLNIILEWIDVRTIGIVDSAF